MKCFRLSAVTLAVALTSAGSAVAAGHTYTTSSTGWSQSFVTTSTRYSITGTANQPPKAQSAATASLMPMTPAGNPKMIPIPATGRTYVLPMSKTLFTEQTGNPDWTMNGNGTITINSKMRILIQANVDWPAQYGTTGALRMVGVIRRTPNQGAFPFAPKGTLIDATNLAFDNMKRVDVSPGSADGWATVMAEVNVDAGDVLALTVRSDAAGDWVQATDASFIELTVKARPYSPTQP